MLGNQFYTKSGIYAPNIDYNKNNRTKTQSCSTVSNLKQQSDYSLAEEDILCYFILCNIPIVCQYKYQKNTYSLHSQLFFYSQTLFQTYLLFCVLNHPHHLM